MLHLEKLSKPTEKILCSSTDQLFAILFNYGTFECTNISILIASCRAFFNDVLFLAFVCVVCEKPYIVWRQTTTGIDKVMTALSLVSSAMVLAFLFIHS